MIIAMMGYHYDFLNPISPIVIMGIVALYSIIHIKLNKTDKVDKDQENPSFRVRVLASDSGYALINLIILSTQMINLSLSGNRVEWNTLNMILLSVSLLLIIILLLGVKHFAKLTFKKQELEYDGDNSAIPWDTITRIYIRDNKEIVIDSTKYINHLELKLKKISDDDLEGVVEAFNQKIEAFNIEGGMVKLNRAA
ncbi:MAG: hypothetical protein AAFX87_02115 [Bacteroidota bacterium]